MKTTIFPETVKYWTGVQRGQSCLMERRCLFSLGWPPSSDGFMIKIPYQPRTSSFPIGLVKTKSDFIATSVDTGLRR